MEVARSQVQTICECSSNSGSVNQNGIILLGNGKNEIMRVSAAGESVTLRKGADSNRSPSSPTFLPDGHRYLFLDSGGIFLSSLDRPQDAPRRIADAGNGFALAAGSAGSYLLLNQPNEIDVLPFDARKGAIEGPPGTLPIGGAQVRPTLSASNTGVLLRPEAVQLQQNIVWFDAQAKRTGDLGSVTGYAGIDLSHDGKRIAIIESAFSNELRIRDLERGTVTKLAREIQPEGTALWSPDDSSLVFDGRDKKGVQRVYRADANNTRPASVLLEGPGLHWTNDWSRDGKYLLYGLDQDKTYRDFWVLPMDKADAKPFQYTHGVVAVQGQFSPDTRFVAYASDESGRFEIVVQTFPDPSKGKWVISQGGGVEPRWSRDGHQLFFFSGQKLMVVDVRETHDSLTVSAPRNLFFAPIPVGFSNDSHRWQLSPDGGRFLLLVPSAGAATASLDVMVNWEQMLRH
jgi:Tol biopolymer transport system component